MIYLNDVGFFYFSSCIYYYYLLCCGDVKKDINKKIMRPRR